MKFPFHVGTYKIGPEHVRVYVTAASSGATLDCLPEDKGCLRFDIGIMNLSWDYCVASLLHEAFEHCMHRDGCGFRRSRRWADSTAAYLFVMPHEAFDNAVSCVAEFMVACMADFSSAWKSAHKQGAKKNGVRGR